MYFWIIVLPIILNNQPAKLLVDPLIAFVSEEQCNGAIKIIRASKVDLPLTCEPLHIIGGVPLDAY